MCGPTQAEKNLENEEASFDSTLQQNYATTFANQQEIYSTLNSVLQPIAEAGPNQQGFSPQELATLNTQAIDSNATGVQQAEQAAGAQEAAQGGGKSFLPSGVNAQISAGIDSAAESNLSNEELGITQANYAAGQQNWQNALAGEGAVATGQNPIGYAGATTDASKAAFGEASTIEQQSAQEFSDIFGAITGGISDVLTGGLSGAFQGGSTGSDAGTMPDPLAGSPFELGSGGIDA